MAETMQAAFAVAAIIAVPTALLSCFLVLKGWSLMGDAVSHAVLPGIVLAYVLGLPLIVGAFAAGMVCSVLTGYLQANSRVKQDTVMGVVFALVWRRTRRVAPLVVAHALIDIVAFIGYAVLKGHVGWL